MSPCKVTLPAPEDILHISAGAGRAAVLLGASHSIRGAFDHSSLDAPQARDTARQTLGGQAFDHAYLGGRELGYDQALAPAEDAVRI